MSFKTVIGPRGALFQKIIPGTQTKRDHGEEFTEQRYQDAARRLRMMYHEAAADLERKQSDWKARHIKRVEKYQAELRAGLITKADYEAWMRGQIFQEEAWALKRGQMARAMVDIDKKALEIINTGKLDIFAENANWMGFMIDSETGAAGSFGLYDRNTILRLIRDQPNLLPMPGIDEEKDYRWYNEIINNAVTQGILTGESLDQIVLRVAEDTGDRALDAMRRNVITAYTGAQNAGRVEGMRQARDELGIQVKKRWMATLDSKTRDAHAQLDGQVADIDEPFDSILGPIMYPGDPDAEPANVYNCRCTLTYVYPKYNTARVERVDAETGERVGEVTYKEWLEAKNGENAAEAQNILTEKSKFEITHASFTPANTVSEAEKYAEQFLGYNGKVSYRGIGIDAANACNQTLADIRANYPDFKLSGIEPMNMRSNMWKGKTAEAAYRWGGDGKLYINPTYYKNEKTYKEHTKEIDDLMKTVIGSGQELIDSGKITGAKADYVSALLETKRQAVSQSYDFMQGTFVHEMGHALEDKIFRRELNEMYPGFDGVRDFFAQSKAQYGKHISGYAIADNHEYVAESFTAWWFGEQDKIDPVLSGLFERVFKK